MTDPRSRRARPAGRKTLPHSASIVARPRCGWGARAVARTSSSNRATSTWRSVASSSSRGATAGPTSPLPRRIITVRSRRSIQSLDGLDFVSGEPPVFTLGEPPEPHRPVGNAVQPLDFESQSLREPPDDALAAFRERDLDLDAALRRAHPEVHDLHRATVDCRGVCQGGANLGGIVSVDPEPVRPGDGEPRVHQPMRRRAVRGEEQQPRRHDIQSTDVCEPRYVGEETVHSLSPLRVTATHHVADRLVEGEPGNGPRGFYGAAVDGHALPRRIHAHADRGHRAVHAHATGADQVLGLAAGRHARTRQGALQAHWRHSGSAGAGGPGRPHTSSPPGTPSPSLWPRGSPNTAPVACTTTPPPPP